ncbi:MAG: nitroreductase family protein [Muribaculum sp.]|nr:nitroreductase family protein [Muribaculum sp.]
MTPSSDIAPFDIDKYSLRRRTVRSYSTKTVPDQLIDRLIEEASHAPTTGNMQLYSVIVTRSPEGKKALAPLHFNQPQVESCSAVLTFCVDINRFVRWCEVNDADPGFDNLQSLLYGILDTALFAQQFNTLAEAHGLGCCYLGTTTFTAPEIAKVLNLPPRVIPLTTITVGYPEGPSATSDRLPLDAIRHDGAYRQYSDSDIKRIYDEKESLEESLRFIKENAKTTLAQVYADVRYPKEMNETYSAKLAEFLSDFLSAPSDSAK